MVLSGGEAMRLMQYQLPTEAKLIGHRLARRAKACGIDGAEVAVVPGGAGTSEWIDEAPHDAVTIPSIADAVARRAA
jgi:hypothetical protein